MGGTFDSRSPNQWRDGPPGWGFDGWGVARGGRDWNPTIPMRPYGAERVVLYVGWSTFGVLVAVAALMNNMWVGSVALLAAAATIISRKVVLRLRTRRDTDAETHRPKDS